MFSASLTTHIPHHQGLRHVFGIGGTEDSRGAPKIFFSRTRDEVLGPLSPKISFLLEFRPLHFRNIKEKRVKKENGENGSGPRLLPFDCSGGERYRKNSTDRY